MATSGVKSFTTSVRDRSDDPVVTFVLDGHTYTARRPKEALTVGIFGADDGFSSMAATARWIEAALVNPADRMRFAHRLTDPEDDFDIADAIEIMRWLVSEFAGRPTESQPSS